MTDTVVKTAKREHAEKTDAILVALHTHINHLAGKRQLEQHAATKLRDDINSLTILHEQAEAKLAELDIKTAELHEAITKRLVELGL